MLQNVSLIFLLCVLQFQCYHSRYLLIDVHGKSSGLKGPGACGDVCFAVPPFVCTGDPKCPFCIGLIVGVCMESPIERKSPGINSTADN